MELSDMPVITDIKEAYDYISRIHGQANESWRIMRYGDFCISSGESIYVLQIHANNETIDYYFRIANTAAPCS